MGPQGLGYGGCSLADLAACACWPQVSVAAAPPGLLHCIPRSLYGMLHAAHTSVAVTAQ